MPAAATITAFHQCPLSTPAGPVTIPHVGGPVIGPGALTVFIGFLPAAKVGDLALCIGPPDAIVKGSLTVKVMGLPAARMGDKTAHGGTIMIGNPTVMIGG